MDFVGLGLVCFCSSCGEFGSGFECALLCSGRVCMCQPLFDFSTTWLWLFVTSCFALFHAFCQLFGKWRLGLCRNTWWWYSSSRLWTPVFLSIAIAFSGGRFEQFGFFLYIVASLVLLVSLWWCDAFSFFYPWSC